MSGTVVSRRQALARFRNLLGAPSADARQAGSGSTRRLRPVARDDAAPRLAPREELVDVPEFEAMAKLALPGRAFSAIAGGDRQAFDRITLRPRMLVPTLDLDLTVGLFGDKLYTPIVVGPVAGQKQFHADGEIATLRGASAAKAAMVVSSRSSVALEDLAAQAATPLWYQVDQNAPVREQMRRAAAVGCKAICCTVHVAGSGAGASGGAAAPIDWASVDRVRDGSPLPVMVKGVIMPDEAGAAIAHGAAAVVVSNGGMVAAAGGRAPIEVLPAIVDAVAGRVPVLVDGGFRRGSDIFKALAFGASGVLVARPVMWGLAAYGAEGVQTVVELLQTELARVMAMCGKPNLRALDRSVLKVHGALKRTTS